ncbi:hypothetical protein C5S32_11065 [ANME-1 cluster archaeon GoMg1]|nr:hypothetical protein [ANME-1 cluster archaeon GoMg1]
MKQMYKNLKAIVPVVLVSVLVLLGAFAVVNAQGQDDGTNPAKGLLFDAQVYASNMNVSVDEAILRFQLQDIAGDLDAELTTNETETFAGLWIEHTPEFRVVVQFTRDGEETMKPYLKKYPEFADIVEVRNTAKVSLADLQRAQAMAISSARALDIPVESDINVFNNSVELYMTKSDRSRFDDALQRNEIQLPDKVRVITVEAEAMGILEADIYGGLPLSTCTSGFSVKEGITKGITTAGHCSNTKSYNGNNLPFQSENWAGSYDIQWHTAPGYTVTNKIRWWSDVPHVTSPRRKVEVAKQLVIMFASMVRPAIIHVVTSVLRTSSQPFQTLKRLIFGLTTQPAMMIFLLVEIAAVPGS